MPVVRAVWTAEGVTMVSRERGRALEAVVAQTGLALAETDAGKNHAQQLAVGHRSQVGGEQVLEVPHQ